MSRVVDTIVQEFVSNKMGVSFAKVFCYKEFGGLGLIKSRTCVQALWVSLFRKAIFPMTYGLSPFKV